MERDRSTTLLAPTASAPAAVRSLVFSVGGRRCALPVETVSGVLRAAALRRVPLAPECVLGIVERHGGVVTVLDLERLLGGTPRGRGDSTLVRLSRPWDHLALRVEEPLRVVERSENGDAEALDPQALIALAEAALALRTR